MQWHPGSKGHCVDRYADLPPEEVLALQRYSIKDGKGGGQIAVALGGPQKLRLS